MKRSIALLCAAAFTLCLVGCGKGASSATATPMPSPTEPAMTATPETAETGETSENGVTGLGNPDPELSNILQQMYAIKDPGIPVDTREVSLSDASWVTYYTGLDAASTALVDAAVASEASIGSQAYSVVLMRVKSDTDAPTVAEKVLNGVDPVKWICVQADDIRAVSCGNLVLLAMMDSNLSDSVKSSEIVDAFLQVTGAPSTYDSTRTLDTAAPAADSNSTAQ